MSTKAECEQEKMFIENFSLDSNSSAQFSSSVKRNCQYYCCYLIASSLIHFTRYYFTFHIQSLPLALLDAHTKYRANLLKEKNLRSICC